MKWIKADNYPGIRYYKHDYRRYPKGSKFYDKYIAGSYQVAGQRYHMGFGWTSEGWTIPGCHELLQMYKGNCKKGLQPKTLKEDKELNRQKEKEKQKKEEIKQKEEITFNEFFEQVYLAYQNGKKQKSIDTEKSMYKLWIKDIIGNTKLINIKIKELEQIRHTMEKHNKSERTIQYALTIVKQVINKAILLDYYKGDNPVSKLKLPLLNNEKTRYLTSDEADKLLHAIHKRSKKWYYISLIALHTGLRASEIFGITWQQVNFEDKTIKIPTTKSKKIKHVYMTDDIYNILCELYNNEINGQSLVFKDRNGHKIKEVSDTIARAVNDVGLNDNIDNDLDKVTFHTFRRTFASWQIQSGIDPYTVQKLMGHSSFKMVQRYAYLAPDNLRKATAIFNKNDK